MDLCRKTRAPFIRSELQRLAEDGNPGAVSVRAALRLMEVLAEHPSPVVHAQVLHLAIEALDHAYRAEWMGSGVRSHRARKDTFDRPNMGSA
jgi:hypothetical protein